MTIAASVLVAGACNGGDKKPPGASVPTEAPVSTTSTTTTASYDVPATIDQAYVQRVVSAYDKVLGDALRLAMRGRALDEAFLKHLVGLYSKDEVEFQQTLWDKSAAEGLFDRSLQVPGDPKTTVVSLVRAEANCVIARAERDFRPTLKPGSDPPESPEDDYIVLVPKEQGRDPLSVNPTPWVMGFDGFKKDNSVPGEACDG